MNRSGTILQCPASNVSMHSCKAKITENNFSSKLTTEDDLKSVGSSFSHDSCGVRAIMWGHYMIQPYRLHGRSLGPPGNDCARSQKIAEAQKCLQIILDHMTTSKTLRKSYSASIFGSIYVYEWWDGYGDVDFLITPVGNSKKDSDDQKIDDVLTEKREQKILLLKIADVLRLCGNSTRSKITPILNARVPIIKHEKNNAFHKEKTTGNSTISWFCENCGSSMVNQGFGSENSFKRLQEKSSRKLAGGTQCQRVAEKTYIHLMSLSLTFYPCHLSTLKSQIAQLQVETAIRNDLKDLCNGKGQDLLYDVCSFFKSNIVFFVWEKSGSTLHIAMHSAPFQLCTIFLRLYLSLQQRKRIGPAPLKAVRHSSLEARRNILDTLAFRMQCYSRLFTDTGEHLHDFAKFNLYFNFVPIRYEFVQPSIFDIDFDISVRPLGLRNSALLRKYFNPPRVKSDSNKFLPPEVIKIGALFLKSWSKKSGINNSAGGMLCTYAINIMWIHFLLNKSYQNNFSGEQFLKFIDPDTIKLQKQHSVKLVENLYSESFGSQGLCQRSPGSQFLPSEYVGACYALGSLVTEFFHYYSHVFRWNDNIITINRTSVSKKEVFLDNEVLESSMQHISNKHKICERLPRNQKYIAVIEDPYEKGFNLARNIGDTSFEMVKKQIQQQYHTMSKLTPKDVIFRPATTTKSKHQASKSAEAHKKTAESTRLEALRTKLEHLRTSFFEDFSSKMLSQKMSPVGFIEVFPKKLDILEYKELNNLLSTDPAPQSADLRLHKLFMLGSFEVSCRHADVHGKKSLSLSYYPIESALYKGIHESMEKGKVSLSLLSAKLRCHPSSIPGIKRFLNSNNPFLKTIENQLRKFCILRPLRFYR